jgi:hypothetical protein
LAGDVQILSLLLASLLSLGLVAGCATTRWAKQWAELQPNPVAAQSPAAGAEAAQAFGLHGFRFARAGAVLYETLDPKTLSWPMAVGEVVPVVWIAEAEQLRGHVIATSAHQKLFVGVARRIAVRERAQAPLFMVAIDRDWPPFVLPMRTVVFDLDLGIHAEVPAGVRSYHCVAAQARELALAEIGRLGSDLQRRRLSESEATHAQDQLAPYLAVDPSLCR